MTVAPTDIPTDTRERLLAAAQDLFARKGVEKTSTREITTAAGANLALVNYYFRSKEGLAEELFARLAQRASESRMAELADYLAGVRARNEPVRLEPLVECMLRPYLEPGRSGQLLARLILQHRVQPNDMTQRVYDQHLDPFALRFIDALCLVDAGVSKAEWTWRYSLMVGTIVLAFTDMAPGNRLAKLSGGGADAARASDMKAQLMRFLCAGLTGPGVAAQAQRPRAAPGPKRSKARSA